jgi:hypothetical protein
MESNLTEHLSLCKEADSCHRFHGFHGLSEILETTHPSFPLSREAMLLVLITGLYKNNELPMSTWSENSDGFPLSRE